MFVNQKFTEPQCMIPSDSQMQPRWLLGVDSAVKHTVLTRVQGTPLSEIEPAGAVGGGVVAA